MRGGDIVMVCLGGVICQGRLMRRSAGGSCDSVLGYSGKRQSER